MEKNVMISILFEYYGKLLSKKQHDSIELYYEEDLSLTEIADLQKVSKQSISETIKRSEKALIEFEDKLGLYKRMSELQCLVDSLEEQLMDDLDDNQYAKYLDIMFQINSKLK
nr:DNA-binding protein [Helcococcus sueciensis]